MYEETATLTHGWTHWVRDARRVSVKTTDGRVINGALTAVQVDDEAPGGSQLRATIRTDEASGAVEAVFQSELVTMRGPGRQSTRASADAEQKRSGKRTPQLVEVKPGESVAAVLAAALGDDSLAAALGAQPSAAEEDGEIVTIGTTETDDTPYDDPLNDPKVGEVAVAVEVEELAPEAVLAAFTAPAVEPVAEEAPAPATIEYGCDTPGCENSVTLADFPAKGELVFCSDCEGKSVHAAEVKASARGKRSRAAGAPAAVPTVSIGYSKTRQTGTRAKAAK